MDISSPTVSSPSSPRGVPLQEEPIARIESRTTAVALRNIPSKRCGYSSRTVAWGAVMVIAVVATFGCVACWGIAIAVALRADAGKGWDVPPSRVVDLVYAGRGLLFTSVAGFLTAGGVADGVVFRGLSTRHSAQRLADVASS